MEQKQRAAGNRTLTLSAEEAERYRSRIVYPGDSALTLEEITNKTICCDLFTLFEKLPGEFADLVILDPPYNLNKNFNGLKFSQTKDSEYCAYLRSWFPQVIGLLKRGGSVYLCGDWKSTACLCQVMGEHAAIRNRIIWQREKGRGAKSNWKNVAEDIWFGTKGGGYYFDCESVKQKRRVLAPYRESGLPRDWEETDGGKFRLTCPGNFWDDISVPYWSMPENTGHPAQKPEKLIAKLILASCPKNGVVLDPFLGSGTTSVVAKKLNRQYVGVEINEEYCCMAEKRLELADRNRSIQGYSGGVFWERNTARQQMLERKRGLTR
jgi:site-specific DNA-methyltransferase (adenine-specific)